jgi:hypothetical protein
MTWIPSRGYRRARLYLLRENQKSRKVRKARARMERLSARGNGRAVKR